MSLWFYSETLGQLKKQPQQYEKVSNPKMSPVTWKNLSWVREKNWMIKSILNGITIIGVSCFWLIERETYQRTELEGGGQDTEVLRCWRGRQAEEQQVLKVGEPRCSKPICGIFWKKGHRLSESP